MREFCKRLEYNFMCVFGKDGEWDMGCDLVPLGSIFYGKWFDGDAFYNTYQDYLNSKQE